MFSNVVSVSVGVHQPHHHFHQHVTMPSLVNSNSNSCCVAHNSSSDSMPSHNCPMIGEENIEILRNLYSRIVISQRGVHTRVCGDSLMPTLALHAMAEDAQRAAKDGTLEPILVISALKLCKPHRQENGIGCKLGSACRNIHLCRQVQLQSSSSHSGHSTMKLPPIGSSAQMQQKLQGGTSSVSSSRGSTDCLSLACLMPTPPSSRPNSGAKKFVQGGGSTSPVPHQPPSIGSSQLCLSRFVRKWERTSLQMSSSTERITTSVSPVPRPPSSPSKKGRGEPSTLSMEMVNGASDVFLSDIDCVEVDRNTTSPVPVPTATETEMSAPLPSTPKCRKESFSRQSAVMRGSKEGKFAIAAL